MLRHIIHKQKITLHIPKKEDATALQASVSNLLQNELGASIDNVLSNAFPDDKIIRIDTLQLNLGTLNRQNFENEFKSQFISELARSLSAQKDNLAHTDTAEELNNAQSLIGAFIYFLEKGVLPWYQSATKMEDWEAGMLNGFTVREYEAFINRILRKQANDKAIQRLVLQCSDHFLEELLSQLSPGFNEPWRMIYKDIALIMQSFNKPQTVVRNKIWQYTFTALPDKKGEEFSIYILQQLAAYFNIKAKDLHTKKAERIDGVLDTATVRSALKQLVIILKKEDSHADNIPSEDVADEPSSKNTEKAKQNTSQSKRDASVMDNEAIYVNNSGLVILHPFLRAYFGDLELLGDKGFIDDEAQQRAVLLLHYMATGGTKVAEFDLALEKVLCGYALENTLPGSIELSEKEISESDNLLSAVINHWPPLKNTSIPGFRGSFLQREGKLEIRENGWLLTVEQKTLDILLGKLPWGISTIRLSWMNDLLNVDWY